MSNTNKFEACFSAGLDLSELFSTNTPVTSASADLLKLKKEEALKNQKDAQEEAIMQEKAAKKAQDQLKRLEENDKREKDPVGFYGALVSMHDTDISGAKKEKKSAKTKAQKRTNASKFKTKNKRNTSTGKAKRHG
jgi:hypothetical protein